MSQHLEGNYRLCSLNNRSHRGICIALPRIIADSYVYWACACCLRRTCCNRQRARGDAAKAAEEEGAALPPPTGALTTLATSWACLYLI